MIFPMKNRTLTRQGSIQGYSPHTWDAAPAASAAVPWAGPRRIQISSEQGRRRRMEGVIVPENLRAGASLELRFKMTAGRAGNAGRQVRRIIHKAARQDDRVVR